MCYEKGQELQKKKDATRKVREGPASSTKVHIKKGWSSKHEIGPEILEFICERISH